MNKTDFLVKFNISDEEFDKSGLVWDDLQKIRDDYEKYRSSLFVVSEYVVNILKEIEGVKYLKSRIKDGDHLIDKIIRKKIKEGQGSTEISIENYRELITDLVGVRVLHLFKDDYENINNFILNDLGTTENPIRYIRYGDLDSDSIEKIKKDFKETNNKDINIEEHPKGYRSMHYVIKFSPFDKQKYFVEIQVRTIFEEGWSEIDHLIRYPNNLNNVVINTYLFLFNRLAGYADEMGTYVKILDTNEKQNVNTIDSLKNKIKELDISTEKKAEIEEELGQLKNIMPAQFADFTIKLTDPSIIFPGRLYSQTGISMPMAGIAYTDYTAGISVKSVNSVGYDIIKGFNTGLNANSPNVLKTTQKKQ